MTEQFSIQRLLLWSRWVVRWLGEARLLWLAMGVVAAALIFALMRGTTEPRIRLSGLGLQVLGLLTVIWGLRQTGQLFGRPTLLMALKAWIARFPSYQRRIVGAVGSATAGVSVSARASVRANAPQGASLENRVKVLERNLGYVSEEIEALHKGLDRAQSELKQGLKDEARQRNEADEKLHQRLEAAQTGGLYVAATGTLWLFVGVCMSTASVELAKWAS